MENIVNDALLIQQKGKIVVDELQKISKEICENSPCLEQEKRIIKNIHGSLIKSFQDAVLDFQSTQTEIVRAKQEAVIRETEIYMNRKLEKDERDIVLNDPGVRILNLINRK
jgi:hypothetical protein